MKDIEKIKAISLDADNTLWDFKKVMKHSLNQVMITLKEIDPIAYASLSIEKMIKIRNVVVTKSKGTISNLEEIRLNAFCETLNVVNRPNDELAKYLNEIYLRHRFEDIELYDDVLPTLNRLKGKYKLGILSNGNSYPEKCGLKGLFDFVVFSQDSGFEKPDPRIFEIALKEAGCKNNQIIHIGDSLSTDILGANNAKIKCVWLNRDNIVNSTNYKIDYEINSLSELLNIL